MPAKGSRQVRLHEQALDILGKMKASNPDAAILMMQNRITELEEQKGITGVQTCAIIADPKTNAALKAMIKEVIDEALRPYVGQR